MSPATSDAQEVRIPAWKRLGLKLKSAQDTTETEPPRVVYTTKRKGVEALVEILSSKKAKRSKPPADNPITPDLVRKKSVSFTPETKIEDGDSIKQLFNSWVTEQKSQDSSFELKKSIPAFSTLEPSRVEDIDPELPEKERRAKRVKNPKVEKLNQDTKSAKISKSKLKHPVEKLTKPSPPFLSYLRMYYEDKSNWKFNKNHQAQIIKQIFALDVITSDHAHFIFAYVKGLQGGVRTRLRDTALAVKVKDIEEGVNSFPETMNDRDRKQREYDEACNEYVATMTALDAPSEMGYEEGVLLGLSDYAMKERMARRMRAEQILAELGASPEQEGSKTVEPEKPTVADGQKSLGTNGGLSQKVARKRKQRTMVEDVDSSSSDSSDSDSSTEAPAQPRQGRLVHNDPDDTSSSSSSSSSESEEEDDSEDDQDSEDDGEEAMASDES